MTEEGELEPGDVVTLRGAHTLLAVFANLGAKVQIGWLDNACILQKADVPIAALTLIENVRKPSGDQ